MIYAGIGSRETPQSVMEEMRHLAHHLALKGYTLRSGGADGADTAFEAGCDWGNGKKEIFIPWNGFSGRRLNEHGVIVYQDPTAEKIASQFHPNWRACKQGARVLHARNVAQILGADIGKDPQTDFVVCWTKNASGAGGTGQAIRIAQHYNIPVFDLGDTANYDRLAAFIPE
ncbi:DprA-like DNA processing chain A [Stenotrophomonas phage Philippe]|uniref:DprA-like DNA processing chain A n=1 Tax=Stenotrophomonas phage Philippe TaxID=2859655 RepID=A0AAE7WMK5_9CAUD|nr:DprA-like DNA processing chain A [Stenotrophomonas phage Philippe]QYW02205.1 DprA-like DNA processing chain A [Stenotrophomonas phage Philippe]